MRLQRRLRAAFCRQPADAAKASSTSTRVPAVMSRSTSQVLHQASPRPCQAGQQALAALQEGAALMGQRDAAGGAQQQLDAQALLQCVDAPADRRRRHTVGMGCGRQAAFGGHRHQRFDLL